MITLLLVLAAVSTQPLPAGLPVSNGPGLEPPERRVAAGSPQVYSYTEEAGPDQSFLLVGEGFTGRVSAWGVHPDDAKGREIALKTQIARPGLVMATVPERAYDGPIVVWAEGKGTFSEPVVLNAPRPWWCWPEAVAAGRSVRIFGRNLAERPDFARGFVCLLRADGRPASGDGWLKVRVAQKYQLEVQVPESLEPGRYQIWVHAGKGGRYGWGGPLALEVVSTAKASPVVDFRGGDLQAAVDELGRGEGGVLRLPEGTLSLGGTLVVPQGVTVRGAGRTKTVLQSPSDSGVRWPAIARASWGIGPNGLHNRGDRIAYKVHIPASGRWQVWLRYATEMSPWKLAGVSGNMTLKVDGGPAVKLEDLPNTGSFGTFRWSRSATVDATAGDHELLWQNERGGGIHLDAFALALDAQFQPGDKPYPASGPGLVVFQAEDVLRFETKDGRLPNGDRAAVWLAGDGASLSDLTLLGSSQTSLGVAVCSQEHPRWVADCCVERVVVREVEGKQSENCAVRLFQAERAVVSNCELWGRSPIFLSGARRCRLAENRLVSVTRFGGNAEAYLQGRNHTVHRCLIEQNTFACPAGMSAGGPTGRRLIWLSTGRGSVDQNWIAENREDRARFGGVAGTDQNVGEMILFEACQRIAYFGRPAAADAQSVTLPEKLAPTPDDRLGSVKREQLAHDAAGNETPFWPPDTNEDSLVQNEAPAGEYFATVLSGRGMGQTRRVAGRRGSTYRLAEPWRVAPTADSLVLVHTGYWRNLLVDNRTVDGMTGIQLWIGCIENVLSDNVVARTRKPGLYLFGNCSTLASSMPATWNRGIGPLNFNHVEGTSCEQTSAGILLISGEQRQLPAEFPRCLGNVLRHNSMVTSRTDGLLVTGGRAAAVEGKSSPTVLGTIAEFNLARDAVTGYHVAASAEATLLRRNLAWFWYPVGSQPPPRTAFQVDDPNAAAALELNSVEGMQGVMDGSVIREQRGVQAIAK
jgi:hypothetical protein